MDDRLENTVDLSAHRSVPTDPAPAIEQPTATITQERTGAADPPDPDQTFDIEKGIPGYVMTHRLGTGAYGQVWQAVRLGAGQDVAIKIFTHPGKLDWRYLQREVDRLLRVAEHPHIVTLIDANLQHEPPFYVMALLRAGSLANLCRDGRRVEDMHKAADWFEQIVRALEFAHGKGLLHCDIKPANVLLDEENNVRLVDFGQSHLRGEAAQALGTLNYMAPEQAVVAGDDQDPPDPSVSWDIYSVGATMYALLAGHPPHSHRDLQKTLTNLKDVRQRLAEYRQHMLATPITPLRRLNPVVDRDLANIIEHCLQPQPEHRYHNTFELISDLKRRREHRPLRCHPRTGSYILKKFIKRNIGMVAVTLAAFFALVTVSATLFYTGQAKIEGLRSHNDELIRQVERTDDDLKQTRAQLRQLQSQLDAAKE